MKRRLTILVLVLAIISSCASLPGSAPVLSWPDDPSTSVAVSWSPEQRRPEIEVRDASGDVRTVAAETRRGFAIAQITDLAPATTYQYRVDDGDWNEFATPPQSPDVFSFAVIGDLQPFNKETIRTTSLVLDKVASLDPLFAVQVGDVAEVGISAGSWKTALGVLSHLGAGTPMVMTAGNHDYYYGIPSARLFKSIFPAPYAEQSARRDTWYSVDVGAVHIAVLDTEASGGAVDRQMSWLASDLAAAREAGQSWLFLVMHRPVIGRASGLDQQRWAPVLLPMIADYGVAAVFWGHTHMFEHREYVYGANGLVLDPGDQPASAPVHLFTVGTGGARVDSLYPGFFTHQPRSQQWEFYDVATGSPVAREFLHYPWNPDRVRLDGEGTRFQLRAEYPKAGSYYQWPFADAVGEADGRYVDDPEVTYSTDAAFFGYSYGETSIHYLWVTVTPDMCTISAHYADGEPGEQGTMITTPGGVVMRFELPTWGPSPSR